MKLEAEDLKLAGSKIVVVGLGISGLWTARYLAKHNAEVIISDINHEVDLDPDTCREIRDLGITLETGGHTKDTFLNADRIIISPGVPHNMELLRTARANGVKVVGEMEFASRLTNTPLIAVTGTNGKTTVTTAIGRLLENAGFNIFVGGNIGTPLIAYSSSDNKADYAVVEVSSFQLDTIETFCPFVSIILNISPDHLDRYSGYEDYVQSKLKIFRNQKPGQYAIINDDDKKLTSVSLPSGPSVFRYGFEKKKNRHAYIQNNELITRLDRIKTSSFGLESYNLPGKHNLENLLAIVLVAQIMGLGHTAIQESINGLKSLPNRLEYVGELNGVAFYNDSKATNVDAAVKAVLSFDQPVILIAGGRHKGADYAPLVRAAKANVKEAVFLGEAKDLLSASFKRDIPFSIAKDMDDAVSKAFKCSRNGDAVLLAPACSSFDMFEDYGHRGSAFKKAVERLVCDG